MSMIIDSHESTHFDQKSVSGFAERLHIFGLCGLFSLSQGTQLYQKEAVGIIGPLRDVWPDGQANVLWNTTFFPPIDSHRMKLSAILFFFETSFPGPPWPGQCFM